MNQDEQLRVDRNEEMKSNESRRLASMEQVDDSERQRLSTRDLATGAATQQARDKAQQDQRAPNGRQPNPSDGNTSTPLFETQEAEQLRNHWTTIQTKFVDEPRRSVEEADQLVASAMKRLAEIFASERESLEHNWDRGDDVSTEDLRIALQRYRSFFDRLLSV